MKSFAIQIVAALALFAALVGGGYWAGHHVASVEYQAATSEGNEQAQAAAYAQVQDILLRNNDTAALWAKGAADREASAAADRTTYQSLVSKVFTHAVPLPPATDCSLVPDAVRLWNDINQGVDSTTGQPAHAGSAGVIPPRISSATPH